MQRSAISLAAVLSLVSLVACGPAQSFDQTEAGEDVAIESQALESCASFDAYTAALGALTVDCLGTVGPNAYFVDKNQHLRRAFEKCPVDERALVEIDHLLGVQLLTKEQPGAEACIAGRFQQWQKEFQASGIKTCPVWKKTGILSAPSERTTDIYVKNLPKLPTKEPLPQISFPKENYVYSVRFPKPPDQQGCRDAADCGAKCIGGFPGAFVSGKGETAVLDPVYWLVTYEYTMTNPFMRAGYYHPMSYYGGLPGDVYGHRNRKGEACSRYYDGVHYPLKMEEQCAIADDLSTCMSRCGSLEAAMIAAGVIPPPAP